MLRAFAIFAALFACTSASFAQPQALPVEKLKKIKAATVFVKVSYGRIGGSGSGFVVHSTKDYGLVVTNEHVVEPSERLRELLPPGARRTVEVVFNSGQDSGEWSAKAEVLHVNKDDDLALLKVKALKPIPEPLSLTGADKLPETTPVYVCGFPFGEDLAEGNKNPEISIGVASVSSNRTDATGQVVTVQLNGALNPGNSGGPVVTPEGKLVGVAVRTLTGAGIGFAVPPAMVRRAVKDVHFAVPTAKWLAGTPRRIRLESRYVDALGNLKNLVAHTAPAPNAWNTPSAEDLAKHPQAKKYIPTLNAAEGVATVELPVPESPHFWLQFSWNDREGAARRSVPVRIASEESKMVEPALPPRPRMEPPTSPFSVPRPAPPRPPGDGRTLTAPDGRSFPLASLATKLGETPKGQMDLDELNRTAAKHRGERLTVDLLTVGAGRGYGDGPSLNVYNRAGDIPVGLDFTVDEATGQRLTGQNFNHQKVVARVTGSVQPPAYEKPWYLFVVDEVALVGSDGVILATYQRETKHGHHRPGNAARVTSRILPTTYPLGSAEAQAKAYEDLRTLKPEMIGRTHRFAVCFFGRGSSGMNVNGVELTFARFACMSPDGDLMSALTLNVTPPVIDAVWKGLEKCPDARLPCIVEFRAVQIKREMYQTPKVECFVTAVSYSTTENPTEPIRICEPSDQTLKLLGIERDGAAPAPVPTSPVPVPGPTVDVWGPGGQPIPLERFAKELRPTPQDQIDVDALNSTVATRIGERLTVEILTTGSVGGYGDGPSLHGYNRHKQMPARLDFVLDRALATTMNSRAFQGHYVAVRLTGTVQRSPKTESWLLFVVEEISLLGPDGSAVSTYARSAKHGSEPLVPLPLPSAGTRRTVEPYPHGSAEAQNREIQELQKFNPSALGQKIRLSVLVASSYSSSYRIAGKTIPARTVSFWRPDVQTEQMSLFRIYARPESGDRLSELVRKSTGRRLPCTVEIQLDQYHGPANRPFAYDCRLLSVSFNDPTDPAKRFDLADKWPELDGVDLRPAVAAPEAKRPAPNPGDEVAPTDEGNRSVYLIAITGAVGLLVFGGIVWAVTRSNARANRPLGKKSRMAARRDRDEDDDEDDRPKRRSRRSS